MGGKICMKKIKKIMAISAVFLLTTLVFAQAGAAGSIGVVGKSNKGNNLVNIALYNTILLSSLKETMDKYTRLSLLYETRNAAEVVTLAGEAIQTGAYINPQEYVKAMKTIAELEYKVGIELKGQVQPSLIRKYQRTVQHLITVIGKLIDDPISISITPHITQRDAEKVAEMQLEICEIVVQMLD